MYVYKEYKPGQPGEVGSLDYNNCHEYYDAVYPLSLSKWNYRD